MLAPLLLPHAHRSYQSINAAVDEPGEYLTLTLHENTPRVGPQENTSTPDVPVVLTLALADLRARTDFWDGVMFGVNIMGETLGIRGQTLTNREPMLRYISRQQPEITCLVIMPDTEATLHDCLISPIVNNATRLSPGLEAAKVQPLSYRAIQDSVIPIFHVTGPDEVPPDAIIEYTIHATQGGQLYPGVVDAYLECVNGYLPKTRIRILDSAVTFKLFTHGLAPGDWIKIKTGLRNLPGRTEKMVRIA